MIKSLFVGASTLAVNAVASTTPFMPTSTAPPMGPPSCSDEQILKNVECLGLNATSTDAGQSPCEATTGCQVCDLNAIQLCQALFPQPCDLGDDNIIGERNCGVQPPREGDCRFDDLLAIAECGSSSLNETACNEKPACTFCPSAVTPCAYSANTCVFEFEDDDDENEPVFIEFREGACPASTTRIFYDVIAEFTFSELECETWTNSTNNLARNFRNEVARAFGVRGEDLKVEDNCGSVVARGIARFDTREQADAAVVAYEANPPMPPEAQYGAYTTSVRVEDTAEDDGLTGGEKAGIAIGTLAGVGVLGGLVVMYKKNQSKQSTGSTQQEVTVNRDGVEMA